MIGGLPLLSVDLRLYRQPELEKKIILKIMGTFQPGECFELSLSVLICLSTGERVLFSKVCTLQERLQKSESARLCAIVMLFYLL